MNSRLSLIIPIAFVWTARIALEHLILHSSEYSQSMLIQSAADTERMNAEEILAEDGKLPFEVVDEYDLELIPGIGAGLSQELIASREAIIAAFHSMKKPSLSDALQTAHGIGPAKAKLLTHYLTLQGR